MTHGPSDHANTAVWTLLIRTTSSTPSSSGVRITLNQIRQLFTLDLYRRYVNSKVCDGVSAAVKCVSRLHLTLTDKANSIFCGLLRRKLRRDFDQLTLIVTLHSKLISKCTPFYRLYSILCSLIRNMPGQLIGRLLGLPAYRDKTTAFVLTAQQTIYRAIIVLLTVTAILWMAVFLYVAFYYSYMPAISHTRPVHLQFESCGREKGVCSFPTANVTLTRRQQLLMVGQPYRVLVELEMPESKRNQEVGMFMVCLDMKDAENVIMDRACRAAILHYKSPLLQYILTGVMAPFLMSGSVEEKQIVVVELFSGFEEDPIRPVTEAMVQVQSQHVEVYKVALRIHAHFTGLRYFMFHWPVLSAFLGIMTNLFFLSVIAFLSWYKFFTPKHVVVHLGYDSSAAKTLEERRAMAKERLMRERSKLVQQKSNETKEDLTNPTNGNMDDNTCESKDKNSKDNLEKQCSEGNESNEVVKVEGDGGNCGPSEDYELISTEEGNKDLGVTIKSETKDDEEPNGDEEDFSELDPESNAGSDKSCKDEDKENVPSLRQRKGNIKKSSKAGAEEVEQSSNC